MEAFEILKMAEDTCYNRFFIIDSIVSDNGSKIRAVIKNPYKGARVQVIKSSKGKLDEEIPEPSLLADPFHRVHVVAKHIFSIFNESRSQQCGCAKADALGLKKYWGYMIKRIGEIF